MMEAAFAAFFFIERTQGNVILDFSRKSVV